MTTQTLAQLLRQNTLSMRVMRSERNSDGSTAHACYLSYRPGNGAPIGEMKLTYRMGSALIDPPTRVEVVSAVLSDSSTLIDADNFEEWAQMFGYDTDSRRAESVYRAVLEQDANLRKLFGSDYELWLSAERED